MAGRHRTRTLREGLVVVRRHHTRTLQEGLVVVGRHRTRAELEDLAVDRIRAELEDPGPNQVVAHEVCSHKASNSGGHSDPHFSSGLWWS